jgi:hypothetical protein
VKHHWFGGLGSVVVWVGMASVAMATDVSLTVSIPSPLAEGGTASTQLRMGVVPGATAGFDTRWDVPAPPTPSENLVTLSARVVPPPSATGQHVLLWDFREEAFPQTWTIEVTSDRPDPITLSWTATGNSDACMPVAWIAEDLYSGTRLVLGADPGQEYQYSGPGPRTRQFVVTADAAPAQSPPPTPGNLWSPRQGRTTVYLAWTGGGDPAIKYHVYRETDQGTMRLTPSPIAATSYVDTGLDRTTPVTYYATSVTGSGCESPKSDGYRLMPRP